MVRFDHSLHVYHHFPPASEVAAGIQRLEDLINEVKESLMAKLDDQFKELTDILGVIGDEVGKVSADTDNLLAQLSNIPTTGLTPEQQALLDSAIVSATAVRDRLQALDDKVPEPPTPTP